MYLLIGSPSANLMASVTPLNSVGSNSLIVTQFHQGTATPNVEQYLISVTFKMRAKAVFEAHAIYSQVVHQYPSQPALGCI